MSDAELAMLPAFLPLAGAALALFAKALHGGATARALEAAGAFIGLALPWAALAALLPGVLAGGASFTVSGWPGAIGIAQRFDGLAWLVDVLVITSYSIHYTKLYEPSSWSLSKKNWPS